MKLKLNTLLDIDMLIENETRFKDFVRDACDSEDLKAVVLRLFERWQMRGGQLNYYKEPAVCRK